jgi:hypothetical protein
VSRAGYRVTIDRVALTGSAASRLAPEVLGRAVAASVAQRLAPLLPGAGGVAEAAVEVGAAVAAAARDSGGKAGRHG